MHIMGRPGMKFRFSSIVFLLGIFSLSLMAQEVYLCLWRNPERTMTKIFPQAKDYRTVTLAISEKQRAAIEGKSGLTLLPGQRDRFQYFEMIGDSGKRIGTIIAASQKGEYGAIEFVFGMDTNDVINGIYIQRSRERDTRFKDRTFLNLFLGKGLHDVAALGTIYKGEKSAGTEAVVQGIRKELATYKELAAEKR